MSDRMLDQGDACAAGTAPSSGPVDEATVRLVQASFQRVVPIADLFADLFYSRLFLLDPSLLPMFRGDLSVQGRKLMAVLRVAVASLRELDRVVPAVEALGARHAGYGVKDEHYDVVRAALLWSFEQALGDSFSGELADAWARVYDLLAGVMKAAAARATAERRPPLSQRPPASQRAPLSRRGAMLSQPPPA